MTTDSRGALAFSPHRVMLAGEAVTAYSRADLGDWRDALPAMELIARHAPVSQGERVLVAPCGNGALGAWAAARSGARSVSCWDSHQTAVAAARQTLDANGHGAAGVTVGVPDAHDGPYDTLLMVLPKGRDLARLWLLNGSRAVRPGGAIVLAGPNRGGIHSVARDAAELLGSGRMLAFKASNRAFVFERPATLDAVAAGYAALGLANGTYATYPLEWAGRAWTICTRPGVFSRDGLDNGTRMLLESLTVRPDERALDLGCGAGVLGLALAVSAPQGHVTLVDVDSLATESASETLARNGITNGTVVMGDGPGVVPGARYTLIASNPPFHSGHEVNLAVTAAFIDASYEALEPGGRLVIVANLFLPYAGPLRRRFGTFDVLARDGRYQVLSCARAR